MFEDYFNIQIFFIIFRETLETAIIVSVLLAFVHQSFAAKNDPASLRLQRLMKVQIWAGAASGLLICLLIGLLFMSAFYILGKDYWLYTERVWEGVFSLLSASIISIMGLGLLRINKVMKVKWWIKLGDATRDSEHTTLNSSSLPESEPLVENIDLILGSLVEVENVIDDQVRTSTDHLLEPSDEPSSFSGSSSQAVEGDFADIPSPQNSVNQHAKAQDRQKFSKKYFLAILPLVTTLREGLEAVVFVGGMGMTQPPSSLPFLILSGIAFGATIGYILYRGGNKMSLQYFLIFLTCFLYVVLAGLVSRGVWFLELEQYVQRCGGLDPLETGSGPGLYDISKLVWHVNCCNGLTDGWWMVLNALVGWTNLATYGSVGVYCAYWILIIVWLKLKLYEERHGYLPILPYKWQMKHIKRRLHFLKRVYT